jgi:hypothetical protein
MTTTLRCLAELPEDLIAVEPARAAFATFLFDSSALDGPVPNGISVVLRDGSELRATTLLDAGATEVLLGEVALIDSAVVERLAAKYGGHRLGLYVPVQRMAVDWSFETVSNADFRVVTPSRCEPDWEILRADGGGSGTLASWWIGQMLERGAQTILLRVDLRDDTDLNLCAGLVEMFGEKLWLAPLSDGEPEIKLAEWVAYGQARQIALPMALYQRRETLLPTLDDPGHNQAILGITA